jgi:hypothetical protein
MTTEQASALSAALDLVNGGLDSEECVNCYAVISNYILQNPPKPTDE